MKSIPNSRQASDLHHHRISPSAPQTLQASLATAETARFTTTSPHANTYVITQVALSSNRISSFPTDGLSQHKGGKRFDRYQCKKSARWQAKLQQKPQPRTQRQKELHGYSSRQLQRLEGGAGLGKEAAPGHPHAHGSHAGAVCSTFLALAQLARRPWGRSTP